MGSRVLALACAVLGGAFAAGPAAADTTTSSNWAGYAAHGKGARFTRVIGMWRQPSAKCIPGRATYSAIWIGLGGYSPTSPALEQVGTELDCDAGGHASSSAWMEMVPAASRTLRLRVASGDAIAASVIVVGHRATLALYDVTTHQGVSRTIRARAIDVSSAEWIVEAPSDCVSATSCQTLPLADFGSTGFVLAEATTTRGHVGGVSDSRWHTTRIRLAPPAVRTAARGTGTTTTAGVAGPSPLSGRGTVFSVVYANVLVAGQPFAATPNIARRLG